MLGTAILNICILVTKTSGSFLTVVGKEPENILMVNFMNYKVIFLLLTQIFYCGLCSSQNLDGEKKIKLNHKFVIKASLLKNYNRAKTDLNHWTDISVRNANTDPQLAQACRVVMCESTLVSPFSGGSYGACFFILYFYKHGAATRLNVIQTFPKNTILL